ncbi:MAG: hypothetical protein H6974_08935 [Gammaproteobacteria bacterium]|nr:hypothetical protein [Gammaproteobacteria bacterium]MCP5196892.1 hypothetical protein [Gammaproteobacteria bacterium]
MGYLVVIVTCYFLLNYKELNTVNREKIGSLVIIIFIVYELSVLLDDLLNEPVIFKYIYCLFLFSMGLHYTIKNQDKPSYLDMPLIYSMVLFYSSFELIGDKLIAEIIAISFIVLIKLLTSILKKARSALGH